jgi:hypothetical protein
MLYSLVLLLKFGVQVEIGLLELGDAGLEQQVVARDGLQLVPEGRTRRETVIVRVCHVRCHIFLI